MQRTLLFVFTLLSAAGAPAAPAASAAVTPGAAAPAAPAPAPIAVAPARSGTLGTPENWAQTLARIASGVVTIQIDSTRAFDTEWNTTAQATGFVIDAKRGLILTNRHVVTPGPVTAQAIF